MILRIEKGRARGRICAPASKSMAHRLLICASMCLGESRIEGLPSCEDVLATIDCLRSFGVKIEYYGNSATVYGIDFTKSVPSGELDCRESGSTLRFLIPFAFLIGREVRFTGSERLMARPQNIYETLAKEEGLTFRREKNSITVDATLIITTKSSTINNAIRHPIGWSLMKFTTCTVTSFAPPIAFFVPSLIFLATDSASLVRFL